MPKTEGAIWEGWMSKSCSSIRWEVETQPTIKEQLMSKKSSKSQRQQTFASCSRDFLSPSFFRQLYQTISRGRKRRWQIQPLLYVLLGMSWCLGDSQPERFETARAFCIALHPKRRRPGKTFQGFQKALEALPCRVLSTVGQLFRKQILARFGSLMKTDGWFVFGCDGSRIRTPRTEELERRLGDSGVGRNSKCKTPQVWLTALVHLSSGMPWSWWVGKGDASERNHLSRLITTLPSCALVVTDAGYQSYLLARELVKAGPRFLMRVSTQTIFYIADAEDLAVEGKEKQVTAEEMGKWTEGEVSYWPKEAQMSEKEEPLKVRLIRIRAKKKKNDVWLVTNVLDTKRLTVEMAGRYYRMRWENEGYFRSYKYTLKKVKLSGRTVAAVHREVLGSMLAMQLLMAQGLAAAVAMGNLKTTISARQLLIQVRREMAAASKGKGRRGFLVRAADCQREERTRTSEKQKRIWSARKEQKVIKPPRIRVMSEKSKSLMESLLCKPA
jgi:hypothetical protein